MSAKGYLLLEGGAEFGGRMSEPDSRAIQLAGGMDVNIAVIPAAAAPDHNHVHAGNNAVRWFEHFEARQVSSLGLIDSETAAQPEIVAALNNAGLIYMLGGFPRHLCQSLAGTPAWSAAVDAYQHGAVLGGSSAGAMVMCQFYFDPSSNQVLDGLNLIPNACVLPHHNRFGKSWASKLSTLLSESILIGIDEQTGMIDDGVGRTRNVYGKGTVTLYKGGQSQVHLAGLSFSL
jgi:cyanophycinase